MRGANAPSPTMRGDIGLWETIRMDKALCSGAADAMRHGVSTSSICSNG